MFSAEAGKTAHCEQKGESVMKVVYSKTGDGQDRTTFHNDDGTIREVTDRKDGGITVTDTDQLGKRESGDGATGITGSHANVSRINTWTD